MKAIIRHSPLSAEYGYLVPNPLRSAAATADRRLQEWALAAAESFTADDWAGLQLFRLRAILTHADEAVPYWQRVFQGVQFLPNALGKIQDIRILPISTRADIQRVPLAELTAGTISPHRWMPARTSGSTGEPLVFYQDSTDLFRRLVGTINSFRFAGVPFCGKLLILGLDAHRQLDTAGFRFSNFENPSARTQILYPYIKRFRPEYAVTTPSTLDRFTYFLRVDRQTVTFRAVQCVGESMSPDLRKRFTDTFQARVFSSYGSAECSRIAVECAHGQHHIAVWNSYVEIVDAAGNTVAPGAEGDVVVTGFENHVMPFIRYRLGDRGWIDLNPCACARPIPVIHFVGRAPVAIKTSENDKFSMTALSTLVTKDFGDGIARFQLEQVSDRDFTFRYVLKPGTQAISDHALLGALYGLTGRNVRIRLDCRETLVPGANGKVPLFVRRPAE